MTDTIKVTMEHEISKKRISDLLCAGFEGGIGYWLANMTYVEPVNPSFIPMLSDGKPEPRYTWYPLNEGGLVRLQPDDSIMWYPLGLISIAGGLRLMASEYPTAFQDFLNDNEDANTGDIFIQLCIFGEVIYS